MSNVVAAALVYQNSVLVAKRQPKPGWGENRWEFPGGKVEAGESPAQALKRELLEELDIEITEPFYKLGSSQANQFLIELFIVKVQDQRWSLKDHEEIKFVHWRDLNQVPFLASNQCFVSLVQDWFLNQGFS